MKNTDFELSLETLETPIKKMFCKFCEKVICPDWQMRIDESWATCSEIASNCPICDKVQVLPDGMTILDSDILE